MWIRHSEIPLYILLSTQQIHYILLSTQQIHYILLSTQQIHYILLSTQQIHYILLSTQALPVIKGLLDKLQTSVKELEGEESGEGIQQHYQNTLAHITHTKANDSSLYADVEV